MTFARGQSSLSYRASDDYDPNDVRLGSVKKWVCYCKAHGKNPAGVCKNQEHIDGLVDGKHEENPEGIIHAKYLQDLKGELKYSECYQSLFETTSPSYSFSSQHLRRN